MPVRWGVLGYARIARESVMPAIVRAANAELAAVASRDAAKGAESTARFGTQHRVHASYEALLEDPAVEAVYIPLPNSLHCEWTIRAAASGKHVLCEKPLALDAGQSREMIAACRGKGVLLMEAFMYRYTARTRQVVEILRSGVLGDIKVVHASFRFPLTNPASIKLKPELGGGSLYDVGCYPVNFAGLVADVAADAAPGTVSPESVAVECIREGGIDVNFSALLRYPSGLLAAVHCGFNAQKRVHAEITGTLGALEIPGTFFDGTEPLVLTTGEERREIAVQASDRYRSEVEDFSGAIREGRAPLFSTVETLRNAVVLDRLLEASRR